MLSGCCSLLFVLNQSSALYGDPIWGTSPSEIPKPSELRWVISHSETPQRIAVRRTISLVCTESFHIACFCGSESDAGLWHVPMSSGIGISSGRLLPDGARGRRGVHSSCRVPHAISAGRNHRLSSSCRLEPFTDSNAATAAAATATATCRIGRVCDSITRRGEGIGTLECGRAAPQRQRFREGSAWGDAGGPLALDALP